MFGIGLDFGTTNSTLALFDGKKVVYIGIDGEEEGVVMPSANYMDREYTATIGTDALKDYPALNQGRQVVLEEVSLGAIRVTHGESNLLRGREESGGTLDLCMIQTAAEGFLIPAVQRLLQNRVPGRVTAHSEFKSIAAGLAIANYHGYQYHFTKKENATCATN